MACTDPLLARTGIAVPCDAALCKNNLHATCAQRLGLLIDNTEKYFQSTETTASTSFEMNTDTVDPLFLTCRKHANEDLVRQRKAACQKMCRQEEARMLTIRRHALSEREERKRLQFLDRHKKGMKALEGVTIAWPEQDTKRRRLLHTSSQYLELFIEKAEEIGQSRQQFIDAFMEVDGASLSFLPPAISTEFFEYFNAREQYIIPEEEKKLESLKKEVEKLREEQRVLEDELMKEEKQMSCGFEQLQDWYRTLTALGVKKIKNPISGGNKKKQTAKRVLKTSTASASSKASTPLQEKTLTRKKALVPNESLRSLEDLDIHPCDTCKKNTEQHLIVQCDECQRYYHLGCLDPPLKRMPKKSKQLGWMCSFCCASSDESESRDINLTLNESRKLRDRSSANMKRKEEEKAENKAFQAAIRENRRPVPSRLSNVTPRSAPIINGAQASTSSAPPVAKKSKATRKTFSGDLKAGAKHLNGVRQNNVALKSPQPTSNDSELLFTKNKRRRPSSFSSSSPSKRRTSASNSTTGPVDSTQSATHR